MERQIENTTTTDARRPSEGRRRTSSVGKDVSTSSVRRTTRAEGPSKRKAGSRKLGRRKRNRERYRKRGHAVQRNAHSGENSNSVQLGDRQGGERVRFEQEQLDEHRHHVKVRRRERSTYTLSSLEIMGLTQAKIEALWKIVLEHNLSDNFKGSYDIFVKSLFDTRTVILEFPPMRAIYYMTGITPKGNADVHAIVLDRKLFGQRELYLQMISKMMVDFDLCRVTAMIPDWNSIAQNVAVKLGFKLEGVLRNWGRTNNKKNDVLLFGLLREELITPNREVN